MRPYSINDVVDSILLKLNADEDCYVVNLKLQKLAYYVQAWSYGMDKKAFMQGNFEAWVHGPVNREIYERFRQTKTLYSLVGKEDVLDTNAISKFEDEDSKFIDMILENYACFSAFDLEYITHSEQPWQEARKGFSPTERCTKIIAPESMQTFYGEKWQEINGIH